jgi:hypothetical protein
MLAPAAPVFAENNERTKMPTWQDEIANGLLPYHQLKVDDFRIDDKAHPEGSYWIKPFIDPRWHYFFKTNAGWYYAYVDQWIIFSGFDRNQSSRKSKFRDMERALLHAQAYLDLNEICARQLAALKPGELPSGRGATAKEAASALHDALAAFLEEKYKSLTEEANQFQKVTDHGRNTKKVKELGNAIRKRLDALPPATVPDSADSGATASPTLVPPTSATPQATQSPAKKPRGLEPPG